MLEKFLERLEAAKREQRNPLVVHARSFAASLMEDRYAAATMQSKLGFIVDLGQWLGRRRLAVTDLDERRIETFIAGRRRNGLCRRGDRTTASQLLDHLREHNIVPRATSSWPSRRTYDYADSQCASSATGVGLQYQVGMTTESAC